MNRRNSRILGIALMAACFAIGYLLPKEHGSAPDEAGGSVWIDQASAARTVADKSDLEAARRSPLVRAAERIAPAVVSIGAEQETYTRRRARGYDHFFPFFDAPVFYQKMLRRIPSVGSGIILDEDGYIVTNHHVVEDVVEQGGRLFVAADDEKEYEAKLVGFDRINDVALLKIEASELKCAPLGDSDAIHLAEPVLAVGNPYGAMLENPSPTITAGVVSARDRFFRTEGRTPRLYEGMIQTDAAINPGNSGGPLVNAAGEVIGVNTFIFSDTGGSVGIGFAIPINRVKRLLAEIKEHGRLRQRRIDLDLIDITRRVQRLLSLSHSHGVLVYSVEPGGPAEAAGLQPGDVVLKVDGHSVDSRREFFVHFFAAQVGDEMRLTAEREGKPLEMKYVIHELSAAAEEKE